MEKLYYYLGLAAVISTSIASIGSFLVYIIYKRTDYLLYATVWGLIAVVDYILWRRPFKERLKNMVGKNECGALRESAELVAIINYLSSHRDEYGVEWRLDSLLSRADSLFETVHVCCGDETYELFMKSINNPDDEDTASETIRMLHECMIKHGCESNVSIDEQ